MNKRTRFVCAIVLSTCSFGLAAAMAAEAPRQDNMPQDVLDAMSRTSTWGHPDQFGEFTGMQRYADGNYKSAMKFFLLGARYADKLSQLSIGLMYLNGQGVQKDPVTAFAWIAIAAERKYPQFLATRDRIWEQLDAHQREQAKALIKKLYPEYGDATAKRRMALELRRTRSEQAGSFLGFGGDSVMSVSPGPLPACGSKTIGGAPMIGCGGIYVAWRWDPKQYFEARDGEWKATVTVGALEPVDGPRATPDARQRGH